MEGPRDFISFVQRNRRDLCTFENSRDDRAATSAILVRVPRKIAPETIEDLPLAKLVDYPATWASYDPESCTFGLDARDYDSPPKENDYKNAMQGKLGSVGVWDSEETFPNDWLVIFMQCEYEAFVLGTVAPNDIPLRYYKQVFGNRDVPLPEKKLEAFCHIVNDL